MNKPKRKAGRNDADKQWRDWVYTLTEAELRANLLQLAPTKVDNIRMLGDSSQVESDTLRGSTEDIQEERGENLSEAAIVIRAVFDWLWNASTWGGRLMRFRLLAAAIGVDEEQPSLATIARHARVTRAATSKLARQMHDRFDLWAPQWRRQGQFPNGEGPEQGDSLVHELDGDLSLADAGGGRASSRRTRTRSRR